MKSYLAYIRVSTVKQGEHGSSLQEQKSAIEAYAARNHLTIAGWYEETETAAKQGRPMFAKMLSVLRRGRADGVIIHKIDRSARNLKDWALIGDLIDQGVDIHFAHESLDLTSRGGRLAADIQAVVASDYIRNLRDEVKKGFYGRLKQGFYPLPAPHGYVDQGAARAKLVDPLEGPLVRQAFELYGTGTYSVEALRLEMHRRGLGTSGGTPLSLNGMAKLLRNPFYVGVIRIWRTNEVFDGVHEAIISKDLFDRVQAIMSGRVFANAQAHDFIFRRYVRCCGCTRTLTGERQKGNAYYRCHGRSCRGTSFTEGQLDAFASAELALLELEEGDVRDFRDLVRPLIDNEQADEANSTQHLARDLALIDDRLRRLTDAYLDGSIDKIAFNERRTSLLMQRRGLEDRGKDANKKLFWETVLERFELGTVALQQYILAIADEKRELLKTVGSNLVAGPKYLEFTMVFPFSEIREWRLSTYGGPSQGQVRTLEPCASNTACFRQGLEHLIETLAKHRSADQEHQGVMNVPKIPNLPDV